MQAWTRLRNEARHDAVVTEAAAWHVVDDATAHRNADQRIAADRCVSGTGVAGRREFEKLGSDGRRIGFGPGEVGLDALAGILLPALHHRITADLGQGCRSEKIERERQAKTDRSHRLPQRCCCVCPVHDLPRGPWLVVIVGREFGNNATPRQVRNTTDLRVLTVICVENDRFHDHPVAGLQQMPNPASRPCVLTIAGSDSGGGAGIQADLKTFLAHRAHGTSVLTAVTAQNTRAVTAVQAMPPRMIRAQIEAVRDDFRIAAWKTGMLADARTIRAVARGMRDAAPAPYVMDPVMIATSGAALLEHTAVSALRDHLLPMARVVTPNLPEATALGGRPIRRAGDIDRIAADLIADGAAAVLIKGGHQRGTDVIDRLYCDGEYHGVRPSTSRTQRPWHGLHACRSDHRESRARDVASHCVRCGDRLRACRAGRGIPTRPQYYRRARPRRDRAGAAAPRRRFLSKGLPP